MKATITFNLPEEQSEYKMHQKAGDMSSAIYEFTNELRSKVKYSEDTKTDWNDVHDMWWNVLKDYGIDPYEN